MKRFLLRFVQDENGQDLVEYTLLLAFVCLASAALFITAGQSLGTIWTDTSEISSGGAVFAGNAITAMS